MEVSQIAASTFYNIETEWTFQWSKPIIISRLQWARHAVRLYCHTCRHQTWCTSTHSTGHTTHAKPPLPPRYFNLCEEALLSNCLLLTVREHWLTCCHGSQQVPLNKQHLAVGVARQPLLSRHNADIHTVHTTATVLTLHLSHTTANLMLVMFSADKCTCGETSWFWLVVLYYIAAP